MVRRKYTKEFKIEAVRLAEDSDVPIDEVARELGIHPNTLNKWRREYLADGEEAFPTRYFIFGCQPEPGTEVLFVGILAHICANLGHNRLC